MIENLLWEKFFGVYFILTILSAAVMVLTGHGNLNSAYEIYALLIQSLAIGIIVIGIAAIVDVTIHAADNER